MAATLHLMVGLPGSGKTTLARQIAAETGAIRLTPDDWHLPLFGDDLMHPEHDLRHTRIENLQWAFADDLLRGGIDVILDFGFWVREQREEAAARGRRFGAFSVIHALTPPLSVLQDRIASRRTAGTDPQYDITADHLLRWFAVFEPPGPEESGLSREGN